MAGNVTMSVPAVGASVSAGSTVHATGGYTTTPLWTVDSVHIIFVDDTGAAVTLNPFSGLSQSAGTWRASFNLPPSLNNWEFLCSARAHQSTNKDNVDHYFSAGTAPT
jgi:hypothetical protein